MQAKTFVSILAALVLVATMLTGATAQSPVSEFDTILAEKVVVTDSFVGPDIALSDDVTVGDDLTVTGGASADTLAVTGNATVGGQLSVSGPLAVSDDFNVLEQDAISVTAGLTMTLAGGVQALESSGVVTAGEINPGTPNQLVILVNTTNTTINIPDSGTHRLAGAAALGQWDVLALWYRGTVWVELWRSNN